ncbi:MAG: hypothetical protein COA83_02150 [Methylophaga sp.]|nr:MAG: hypothetical protein COA83_02150 [Methylophaga sp.]
MAKISREQWDLARALFEAGKSLSVIVAETEIAKSTLSEKAKKHEWEKGLNEQLILDDVRVQLEKANLNDLQAKIHVKEVEKLLSNQMMVRTLSRANMSGIGEKLLSPEDMTINDHKIIQDTINTASLTLGVNQR